MAWDDTYIFLIMINVTLCAYLGWKRQQRSYAKRLTSALKKEIVPAILALAQVTLVAYGYASMVPETGSFLFLLITQLVAAFTFIHLGMMVRSRV